MNVLKFTKRFIVLTMFMAMIFSVSPILTMPVLASNINNTDLNLEANIERASAGLPSLKLDPLLSSAALAKANDMITVNYWAHNSPIGKTPWSFISTSGYAYATAGENLAKGFDTSKGVIDCWMASPDHKANVLNNSYTDVGYAVVDGKLVGVQTTLVVAMYGSHTSTIGTTTTVISPLDNLLDNIALPASASQLLAILSAGTLLSFIIAWTIRTTSRSRSVLDVRAAQSGK